MLKKVSVGLALIAVGFLAGTLIHETTGNAEQSWIMGDLAEIASRVGAEPTPAGQYVVSDILNKLADRAGVPSATEAAASTLCRACVSKLNEATDQDFAGMPNGPSAYLLAMRPIMCPICTGVASIENAIWLNSPAAAQNLQSWMKLVQWLCPELY